MSFRFINEAIKAVRKYKYVSFDVFDTLLKRDVYKPKDVFLLVQKDFEKYFGIDNSDFYNLRISAERAARTKSASGEINFDQIYNELKKMNRYTEDQIEYLKGCELKAEKSLLHANRAILPLYDYCIKNDKKIVILTDMYLSAEFIGNMLKRNGFRFDYIFVSNECGKMKYNGTIYPHVLKKLNIGKKEIIHIGDSWRADFLFAVKTGIKSLHIPKLINYIDYGDKFDKKLADHSLEERTLSAFVNNKDYGGKSEYYKIGYQTFGIVLYNLSKWLKKQFDSENIENIFFLSRDGYIMKKAYDIIYPDSRSGYLYVSRRSLTVPSLMLCSTFDEICEMLTLTRRMSVSAFMKKLGLDAADYKAAIAECTLTEKTVFDGKNIKSDERIMRLYKTIKDDVMKNSQKEYSQLLSYLKNSGFSGKTAVIDIGWQGTMQKALTKIISSSEEIEAEIYGYYAGLKSETSRSKGYFFSGNKNRQNEYKIFSFGGLFETFFLAQHGSVEKYRNNEPLLYEYEYENNNEILTIVNDIQSGAIDFVTEFSENRLLCQLDFNIDSVIGNIAQLGGRPDNKTIELFSDVFLYDTEKYPLIPEKSFLFYCFHLKDFVKGLQQSFWKVGYLKKIFRIKLPYDRIYMLLKKSG